MTLNLKKLSGAGRPLREEPADAKEFDGLVRSGLARLADACNGSLAIESRFDLAYNAAHALCLAALRRMGYRPAHRYIVFQSIPETLGLGPDVWRVLDRGHQLRNLGEYEGDLRINARIVDDLIAATRQVAEALGLDVPQ